MMVIVVATAATGLLASSVMLSAGLKTIWLRYVLAVGVAYVGFLFFVQLWLWYSRDYLQADLNPVDALELVHPGSDGSGGDGSAAGDLPVGLDADLSPEGCLVLVLGAATVMVVAGGTGYLVMSAPTFFAEVLLDGALSYGLYRRVRHLDRRHWLESAVSSTWGPFASAACLLALLGVAMVDYAPGADSIGDVWTKLRQG